MSGQDYAPAQASQASQASQDLTAPTSPLQDANHIEIRGPIEITYDRTSITGRPLLSYHDAELTLSFSGEEITRTQTPIGELVTVTVESVVDAFDRRMSLLVPVIRLELGEQVDVETLLVETVDHQFAFVAAPGPRGVLQTYRESRVHGTAQIVIS